MMLQSSYKSHKSLHFRLQPTPTVISVRPNFPHWHTISQLLLSVFLWEFTTLGIYYTRSAVETQYSYTLISWISTSYISLFSCSPVFRFSVGVTHGRFTNPAPAKAWLLYANNYECRVLPSLHAQRIWWGMIHMFHKCSPFFSMPALFWSNLSLILRIIFMTFFFFRNTAN